VAFLSVWVVIIWVQIIFNYSYIWYVRKFLWNISSISNTCISLIWISRFFLGLMGIRLQLVRKGHWYSYGGLLYTLHSKIHEFNFFSLVCLQELAVITYNLEFLLIKIYRQLLLSCVKCRRDFCMRLKTIFNLILGYIVMNWTNYRISILPRPILYIVNRLNTLQIQLNVAVVLGGSGRGTCTCNENLRWMNNLWLILSFRTNHRINSLPITLRRILCYKSVPHPFFFSLVIESLDFLFRSSHSNYIY
jgi:hypothetical protein